MSCNGCTDNGSKHMIRRFLCAAVGVGHDFNAHELLFVGVEVRFRLVPCLRALPLANTRVEQRTNCYIVCRPFGRVWCFGCFGWFGF